MQVSLSHCTAREEHVLSECVIVYNGEREIGVAQFTSLRLASPRPHQSQNKKRRSILECPLTWLFYMYCIYYALWCQSALASHHQLVVCLYTYENSWETVVVVVVV